MKRNGKKIDKSSYAHIDAWRYNELGRSGIWITFPVMLPGELDETYASFSPIPFIIWKHDVIHKTGSSNISY